MWTVLICCQREIGIDADVLGWSDLGVAKRLSLRKLVVRSAIVDHHDRSRNRELLWCMNVRINVGVRGNKKGGRPAGYCSSCKK